MKFVANHQIVHGAKRNLRIDQGKAGDATPGRRIAGGDVVDRVERKKQDLAIASGAEADDPGAAGDRRSIAAPVPRGHDMGDIGSALARRVGDPHAAGGEAVHAAGRVAHGIDRLTGPEGLQGNAGEHGAAEVFRRLTQPAARRDNGFGLV